MITFREASSVIWMNGAPGVMFAAGALESWHMAYLGLLASLIVSVGIGLPCAWLNNREQIARDKREQERKWGPAGNRLGHPRG